MLPQKTVKCLVHRRTAELGNSIVFIIVFVIVFIIVFVIVVIMADDLG